MNVALRQPMSLDEFLAWEARQEFRYEFDGFQPVAMTGGTRAHASIQRNLAISIGGRLRGTPCQFLGSDFQLRLENTVRYPDGAVFRTRGAPSDRNARDPVVVFEVLSASTAGTDRVAKNREYQATSSVQRYVMLEQDRIAAIVFDRAGGDWSGHLLTGSEILRLPEIGIELPLSELYEDVDLTTDDAPDEG